MSKYAAHLFFKKNIRLFVARVLFLVVFFHTVHFDHDHLKEILGNASQAIMHGSDKKYLFSLILPAFDASAGVSLMRDFFAAFFLVSVLFLFRTVFDSFREALRRGIIHPKRYS